MCRTHCTMNWHPSSPDPNCFKICCQERHLPCGQGYRLNKNQLGKSNKGGSGEQNDHSHKGRSLAIHIGKQNRKPIQDDHGQMGQDNDLF